jgi:hypothetical protein
MPVVSPYIDAYMSAMELDEGVAEIKVKTEN